MTAETARWMAFHYEAHGCHSLTDLWAPGHSEFEDGGLCVRPALPCVCGVPQGMRPSSALVSLNSPFSVFVERRQTTRKINENDKNDIPSKNLSPTWMGRAISAVASWTGTPAVDLKLKTNIVPVAVEKAAQNKMHTTMTLSGAATASKWESSSHDQGNEASVVAVDLAIV